MKACFARTKTAVAVSVALAALAVTTPSFAVNHSDTGIGEVALVPYYTVRGGYDTNISVVNTSDTYVVAFKIRFREGANSRDARDFNVFLSPNDVWTATVSMGADGATPYIQTVDTTCTAPWISTDRQAGFVVVGQTADGRSIKQLDFTNIAYAGGSVFDPDGGPTTIERAQEGHFEIIEMGVALPRSTLNPAASTMAAWAVHGPGQDCASLANVYPTVNNDITVTGSAPLTCNLDGTLVVGDTADGNEAFQAEFCEPLNLLKVSANLMRVDRGVAGGMPVSTLANFYNPLAGVEDLLAPDADDLMQEPQSSIPDLANVNPPVSVQVAGGTVYNEEFADPIDAVSSLFSATDVINEYAVGGAALAQNAWVVSFPTKNFYVDPEYVDGDDPVPFQQIFTTPGISCVTVNYDYFNREEVGPSSPPGGVLPSPPPVTPIPTNSVCYESQVLNFTDDALLGSQHNYVVELEDGFTAGWMRLGFPAAGTITSVNGIDYRGLPTIGFALKTLENGVAGDFTLNYGITTPHAYYRDITAP